MERLKKKSSRRNTPCRVSRWDGPPAACAAVEGRRPPRGGGWRMQEHASSVARPGDPGCSVPGRCVYGIPNFTASRAGLVSVKTEVGRAARRTQYKLGWTSIDWYRLVYSGINWYRSRLYFGTVLVVIFLVSLGKSGGAQRRQRRPAVPGVRAASACGRVCVCMSSSAGRAGSSTASHTHTAHVCVCMCA